MNRRTNAFTLIEVLLAVFIIALGSLGIFALFAGVASEQARASELSRAVGQAQGLLRSLESRVGPVDEWVRNTGLPAPDPVFGRPLARGVWYPAFGFYGSNYAEEPTLRMNPQPNSLTGGRFFVAPPRQIEVYSNPAVYVSPGNYRPYTNEGQGVNSWQGNNQPFAGATIATLPHTRAALGTVRVEFWKSNTMTGVESIAATVDDIPLVTQILSDNELFNDVYNDHDAVQISPNDANPNDPTVLFVYAEYRSRDDANLPARLEEFDLDNLISPDEWISSIRITYSHREDQLFSLSERVRPINNGAGYAGVTAFYRRTLTGRTQFLTLAYVATPVEANTRFIPPENALNTGDAARTDMLRVVQGLRLGYDADRGQYYIAEPSGLPDEDRPEVGDILIVGGQLDAEPTDLLHRQGADAPVVVRRIATVGGERRAYLDDAPRVGGRAMLRGFNSSPVNLSRVFSLRRQVTSAADGSVWQIRPVDFQTLDVQ